MALARGYAMAHHRLALVYKLNEAQGFIQFMKLKASFSL